jgi:hypothetical protein
MSNVTCNVFISHIHEDDGRLQPLKDLLATRGCTVRDASIDSRNPNNASDPEYIKREILAPGIQWAGTLVVLVTPETCQSEWVNWEVEYAHRLGKRIVGVWDHGEAECDVPENLEKYGHALVGWHAESIMDAILGEDCWQTAAGDQRSKRELARYSCA